MSNAFSDVWFQVGPSNLIWSGISIQSANLSLPSWMPIIYSINYCPLASVVILVLCRFMIKFIAIHKVQARISSGRCTAAVHENGTFHRWHTPGKEKRCPQHIFLWIRAVAQCRITTAVGDNYYRNLKRNSHKSYDKTYMSSSAYLWPTKDQIGLCDYDPCNRLVTLAYVSSQGANYWRVQVDWKAPIMWASLSCSSSMWSHSAPLCVKSTAINATFRDGQ